MGCVKACATTAHACSGPFMGEMGKLVPFSSSAAARRLGTTQQAEKEWPLVQTASCHAKINIKSDVALKR